MSKVIESDTRLIIHDNPHPIRLLISTPFFIAGGYFVYHLLGSLYEYTKVANAAEWLSALPGMGLMLIFAVVISLPGIFLASRESIVVNKNSGVIGKRRELLGFHTRGKLAKLSDVKKIICRQETRKHTDRKPGSTSGRTSSVTIYIIGLELDKDEQLTLIEYSEKSDARTIAKALSEFSGLPLNDRLK